jgi:hypothetical protein
LLFLPHLPIPLPHSSSSTQLARFRFCEKFVGEI